MSKYRVRDGSGVRRFAGDFASRQYAEILARDPIVPGRADRVRADVAMCYIERIDAALGGAEPRTRMCGGGPGVDDFAVARAAIEGSLAARSRAVRLVMCGDPAPGDALVADAMPDPRLAAPTDRSVRFAGAAAASASAIALADAPFATEGDFADAVDKIATDVSALVDDERRWAAGYGSPPDPYGSIRARYSRATVRCSRRARASLERGPLSLLLRAAASERGRSSDAAVACVAAENLWELAGYCPRSGARLACAAADVRLVDCDIIAVKDAPGLFDIGREAEDLAREMYGAFDDKEAAELARTLLAARVPPCEVARAATDALRGRAEVLLGMLRRDDGDDERPRRGPPCGPAEDLARVTDAISRARAARDARADLVHRAEKQLRALERVRPRGAQLARDAAPTAVARADRGELATAAASQGNLSRGPASVLFGDEALQLRDLLGKPIIVYRIQRGRGSADRSPGAKHRRGRARDRLECVVGLSIGEPAVGAPADRGTESTAVAALGIGGGADGARERTIVPLTSAAAAAHASVRRFLEGSAAALHLATSPPVRIAARRAPTDAGVMGDGGGGLSPTRAELGPLGALGAAADDDPASDEESAAARSDAAPLSLDARSCDERTSEQTSVACDDARSDELTSNDGDDARTPDDIERVRSRPASPEMWTKPPVAVAAAQASRAPMYFDWPAKNVSFAMGAPLPVRLEMSIA